MLETAIKVLKKIEEASFQAYIVGGYVRDFLLGIESHDIDIATSATPRDLMEIFQDACLPNEEYGAVTLHVGTCQFEITTFRREFTYFNNRKPIEIEYIEDLKEDLLRRDFTINTLVMDSNKEIKDILGGREDLENQVIKTVGVSYDKFKEDSLRILRAIRFATILHFELSDEVKDAIGKTKHLLKGLSYQRKKEELDKIFLSPNVFYGIPLLVELGLDEVLEIRKVKEVKNFTDLMGVWAMLEVDDIYPFTRNEKELMKDIRACLSLDNLKPYPLYRYRLYANSVAGGLKGINKKKIAKEYEKLVITSRKEIQTNSSKICEALHIQPGPILKDIWVDLEQAILNRTLENEEEKINDYLIHKYLRY